MKCSSLDAVHSSIAFCAGFACSIAPQFYVWTIGLFLSGIVRMSRRYLKPDAEVQNLEQFVEAFWANTVEFAAAS